jgi:phosphoglycolate phosphatase
MTPYATVLLFDIDGTLIDNGGAGRRALDHAFCELFGSASLRWLEFSFAGKTDPAIVKEALRRGHQANEPGDVEQVLDRYVQHLPTEIENAAGYEVCPGVPELLLQAQHLHHLVLGLGTGNVRRGAEVKLARGGLNHFFSFGGFGSDHEDRAELLRVGAQRGAELLELPPQKTRVVVIGDTPRDVMAALAIDAECIGVGTGQSSPEELLACGAKAAFADLLQEGAAEAILS